MPFATAPSTHRLLRRLAPFGAALALTSSLAAQGPATAAEDGSQDGGAAPRPAPSADAVSGVTITWDLEGKHYRQPTAAAAARIAEEFTRRMRQRFADGRGVLAGPGQVEVKTLPDGTRMARLPVDFLNASVLRLDGDQATLSCTDGPSAAADALRPTATAQPPVEE